MLSSSMDTDEVAKEQQRMPPSGGNDAPPLKMTTSSSTSPPPPSLADDTPKPTKQNKKKKTNAASEEVREESNLESIWICTECKEAECLDDADAPLLLCDGRCNRPFHPPCANLLTVPPDDKPWLCVDCTQRRHQCIVCKEYGEDDIDVFCCDAKGCGLFFHENCLTMYSVNVQIVEVEVPTTTVAGDDCIDGEEKKESEDGAPMATTITKIVSRPKFRCPAHECWTCAGDIPPKTMTCEDSSGVDAQLLAEGEVGKKGAARGKKKRKGGGVVSNVWGAKKERLFRCLDCPISYHLTCMHPSCRFHELAMLCHEHAHTSKLPYLDAEYSFQAEVEADAEKKLEDIKRKEERRAVAEALRALMGGDEDTDEWDEEENLFLPGLVGSAKMFEEDQLAEYLQMDDADDDGSNNRKRKRRPKYHYCIPADFKEEVHSKPPAYTHVNSNRYNPQNRPKRHPPSGESCHCKPATDDGEDVKSCDIRCLNRLAYTECVGDKTLKSGEKNPYWNCNCGPNCGNRAMSKRQFAKCRPMREHGKGWGLIAVNGVKKGDLVQEYAGEIIDEKTKEERLKEWARDHPNDPNFYVMHLEPGWYIDAREVANMARFINHSCDPNCKLVPVNVNGHMRVAIVCIKDVAPGGFLCYDYQFDTQHGEKFICRCGATNCRGTMKGGKADDDSKEEKKTKKQQLSEAKARIQRDKKFLQSVYESEKERLHLTGPLVPGAENAETAEMVAGGPKERYRLEAQEARIFLWRNARAGGDFSSRYWRSVARKKGGKTSKQKWASPCRQLGNVDVISVMKD